MKGSAVFLNVVLSIGGHDAVPVRAVPYITGGHISPLGIVQVLLDPNQHILGHALRATGEVTTMLPKNWDQFKQSIKSLGEKDSQTLSAATVALLPPSVFVHLADLERVYEDNYLPAREDLVAYTPAEREDFQMQFCAYIPEDLVPSVLEGFPALRVSANPTSATSTAAISTAITAPESPHIPEAERRLALLRSMGGDVTYTNGETKVSGISKLVASEVATKKLRCSEKTIRADLHAAFHTEREARRPGFGAGLAQK